MTISSVNSSRFDGMRNNRPVTAPIAKEPRPEPQEKTPDMRSASSPSGDIQKPVTPPNPREVKGVNIDVMA